VSEPTREELLKLLQQLYVEHQKLAKEIIQIWSDLDLELAHKIEAALGELK